MTSVEVLAARDLVRSLPDNVYGARYAAAWLGSVGEELKARELEAAEAAQELAEAEAAEEKASEQAAVLAAYGGTAAAEAGWNALRQHNPKVDRSTGERDINSFDELPHALKLNYAAFAFGVLNPGAKLSKARRFETFRDVPEGLRVVDRQGDVVWWSGGDLLCARFDKPVNRGPNSVFAWADQFAPFVEDETAVESESAPEPHQFKVGDKVRITGPVQTADGGDCYLLPDQVATVVDAELDIDGDVLVHGELVGGDGPCDQWIDPASLTWTREWDSVEEIPVGVKFTNTGNPRNDYWVKDSDTEFPWHEGGYRRSTWRAAIVDGYRPFSEVIA
ncbi:UNVERIFIED_ORG: hypothetical protein M2328_005723 [Rhodococcus erythropolis]